MRTSLNLCLGLNYYSVAVTTAQAHATTLSPIVSFVGTINFSLKSIFYGSEKQGKLCCFNVHVPLCFVWAGMGPEAEVS